MLDEYYPLSLEHQKLGIIFFFLFLSASLNQLQIEIQYWWGDKSDLFLKMEIRALQSHIKQEKN